jgi:hypothetical protein
VGQRNARGAHRHGRARSEKLRARQLSQLLLTVKIFCVFLFAECRKDHENFVISIFYGKNRANERILVWQGTEGALHPIPEISAFNSLQIYHQQ